MDGSRSHHLWTAGHSLCIQLVELPLEQLEEVFRSSHARTARNDDYMGVPRSVC
jgi:hypothetical protein